MNQKLTTEAITDVIQTVTVELGDPRKLNGNEMSLCVQANLLRAACEQQGLDLQSFLGKLISRYPRLVIQATPDLCRIIQDRGVYGLEAKDSIGRGKGLGNSYYLQVLDCNRLSVRYPHIIGGWTIGELTGAQYSQLVELIAEGIKAQVQLEEAA